jgi:hypothetical protein
MICSDKSGAETEENAIHCLDQSILWAEKQKKNKKTLDTITEAMLCSERT